MKERTPSSVAFWVFVVVAPVLASLIAIAQFPPGIEVPLHWDFSGQVDSWGSPWMMLPVSLIMCAGNALMGVMYRYSDTMYDMGLVHGVSRKNVRPFLCGTAVVLVIVMVVLLGWWVMGAEAAM